MNHLGNEATVDRVRARKREREKRDKRITMCGPTTPACSRSWCLPLHGWAEGYCLGAVVLVIGRASIITWACQL